MWSNKNLEPHIVSNRFSLLYLEYIVYIWYNLLDIVSSEILQIVIVILRILCYPKTSHMDLILKYFISQNIFTILTAFSTIHTKIENRVKRYQRRWLVSLCFVWYLSAALHVLLFHHLIVGGCWIILMHIVESIHHIIHTTVHAKQHKKYWNGVCASLQHVLPPGILIFRILRTP